MIKGGVATPLVRSGGGPFWVVPANAGPRTMDYEALFNAAITTTTDGIRTFAGTTDDGFWIDLGGAFDTLNTHKSPPVLSAAEDAAYVNLASDTVSGYVQIGNSPSITPAGGTRQRKPFGLFAVR